MANVMKVQAGYKAQTLSSYLHQPAPSTPTVQFPFISKNTIKTNFFQYLDFALQFAPAGAEEQAIRARLARIGIGAGKTFDFDALDLEHKLEVGLGMKAGEEKVTKAADNLGKSINGWKISSAFGDRSFFHGDWLLRACFRKGVSPRKMTFGNWQRCGTTIS